MTSYLTAMAIPIAWMILFYILLKKTRDDDRSRSWHGYNKKEVDILLAGFRRLLQVVLAMGGIALFAVLAHILWRWMQ